MPHAKVGILALQGGFEAHRTICPAPTRLVRYPEELGSCDGLIIPGGESTTMWTLAQESGLLDALRAFPGPIFGTCAGVILLARLGLLDIGIERNGYGRQIDSFLTQLTFQGKPLAALFIRAPRITHCGEGVTTLTKWEGEPVIIQQGRYLGATFHPELTKEPHLHTYFLELCDEM